MKTRTKLVGLLFALFVMMFSLGAGYASNTPKLNIDKRPVYAKCSVADVVREANKDYKGTSQKYKDKDIIDYGIISSIAKNKKSIIVKFSDREVSVSAMKSEVGFFSKGDGVAVYGQFAFGSEKKKEVTIEADHLGTATNELSSDYYIYGGDKSYVDKNSVSVSLADNRIKFNILKSWAETEVATDEAYQKIFNSEIYRRKLGKFYYVNRADGEPQPELFGVFYFDYNVFLEQDGDKKKTHDIEKAIISNICPKELTKLSDPITWKIIYPTETSTSSKGVKFDHYVGVYDNYRVEFAFTPVNSMGNDDGGGLCVIIYMYYNDSTNPNHALYTLNSLTLS
jgi:hypothetical protein